MLLLAACAPTPGDPTALDSALREASEAYGVPYDLLAAMSWELSRFDQRDGAENTERGVGLLNLRTDGAHPSLAEAAALVNADPDDVVQSERLTLLASAALLARQAHDWHAQTGEKVDDLDEWYPLVAAWSGAADPLVADGFASRVYDLVEWGFAGTAPSGEIIVVDAAEMQWRMGDELSSSSKSAQWVPASSSNYTNSSRGAGDIDTIVIHTTQGSYSGSISWFQNSAAAASAHYVIRSSDGEITQMVDEEDIAWHAGHWDTNEASIGIEHEGYVEDPATWYTDAMYRASAELVADLCDRYGIPKDRAHVIGHNEVPGCSYGSGGGSGCHTDPGSGWDWDYFMSLVNGTGSGSTSMGGSGVADGPRSGSFTATVTAASYGVTDSCSGSATGSVNGGQVYMSATCRLVDHPDASGDLAVTWSGSVSGTSVTGRVVVDGHSASWTGTVNSDGSMDISLDASEDLGGDVGLLRVQSSLRVDAG